MKILENYIIQKSKLITWNIINELKKVMITNIALILWSLPKYIWYTDIAPSEDSQLYKSLNGV